MLWFLHRQQAVTMKRYNVQSMYSEFLAAPCSYDCHFNLRETIFLCFAKWFSSCCVERLLPFYYVVLIFCLYHWTNWELPQHLRQQTFVGFQDVFKTSSRHVLETSSTRFQRNNFSSSKTSYVEDVFKTSPRHVLKTSSRPLGDK